MHTIDRKCAHVKDNVRIFTKSGFSKVTMLSSHNIATNGLPGAIARALSDGLKIDGMYFGFVNNGTVAPYTALIDNNAAYYANHEVGRSFVRVPLIGKPVTGDSGSGPYNNNIVTFTAVASADAFHTSEQVIDGQSVFNHAVLVARGTEQSSDIICAAFDFPTSITKAAGVACGAMWSLTFEL